MNTKKTHLRMPLFAVVLAILVIAAFWVGCQKQSETMVAPNDVGNAQITKSSVPGVHDMFKVMEVQNKHTNALLARRGVIGTATTKLSDGGYAIKILTKQGGLERTLPAVLDGVPVVVSNVGEIRAQDEYTGRYRPVKGGVSGGNMEDIVPPGRGLHGYGCFTGTISCVVEKGGQKFLLSNNHVFARINKAKIGEPIVQPGLADMNCDQVPADIVAHLTAYKKILWQPLRNSNEIDAAIAAIQPGVDFSCSMICGYTPGSPVEAELGMDVKKCGRTTGLTTGMVTGINVTVVVNYMPSGYARFDNQVEFTNMSDSGDSGSLIVSENGNHPVALLYAGSDVSTIGNPIQAVLDYFGVTICSE